MSPNFMELAVLWLAGFCFGISFLIGWRSIRVRPALESGALAEPVPLFTAAHAAFAVGLLLAAALAVWRVVRQDPALGDVLPFANYFDAFLLLGLLLVALDIYFHWTRHLRGLAFFLLPMIAGVFLIGGVLSLLYPRAFDYKSPLNMTHVITVFVGSACFAAGCVGGSVYLLADWQLRRKRHWIRLPALASLEKFTRRSGFLGFPMLTLAMITGAIKAHQVHAPTHTPKIALAVAAWLVYAALLHLPSSFRGRRAAWLGIVGFVLLVSVFFAVR